MSLDVKEWLGLLSIAVAVIAYLPYIRSVIKGNTKPHAFSWILWLVLQTIGLLAQWSADAGPGAWATAATNFFCFFIAVLALFKGEKNITRSDWISFIAALCAIPLWVLTKDPVWSVILITLIDAVAFYPTFRKTWNSPQDELPLTFILSSLKFSVALLAMENYSLVTALYPASLVLTNFTFVVMLFWRRHVLSFTGAKKII